MSKHFRRNWKSFIIEYLQSMWNHILICANLFERSSMINVPSWIKLDWKPFHLNIRSDQASMNEVIFDDCEVTVHQIHIFPLWLSSDLQQLRWIPCKCLPNTIKSNLAFQSLVIYRSHTVHLKAPDSFRILTRWWSLVSWYRLIHKSIRQRRPMKLNWINIDRNRLSSDIVSIALPWLISWLSRTQA
jgi:hypothetical protein